MNWGHKLILVFIAFALSLSYMVYRCMQLPVDLVSKDYYRDELAYQQVIDGAGKAGQLSSKVQLRQDTGYIVVQLPPEMCNRAVKGNILFYCAANAGRDRQLALQPDTAARQLISTRSFIPGNYTVKITWEAGGVQYYSEEAFHVL